MIENKVIDQNEYLDLQTKLEVNKKWKTETVHWIVSHERSTVDLAIVYEGTYPVLY